MQKKIKNIAIIRLSAMGDVAMTVPVLRAFAHQYPEINIILVSNYFYKPLFEGISSVRFFSFDAKNRHKGFVGLFRLYQDLRALNIDAFVDLHNVLRSKIVRTLFSITGKKTAFLDKGRKEKAALTRSKNKIFKPLTSMFERHVKVFESLGFNVDLSKPLLPKKVVLIKKIIRIIGVKHEKLIGIAPFAQYKSKTYPIDLMQEVIDKLALNENHKILLFGGGTKEIQLLNSLSEQKKNVIVIAGKINFGEELALISNLDVMLAMDSGNAHLAAMFGARTITLWGATHPYAGFAPFNQPFENALVSDRTVYPKLPTSVYGKKKVKGYKNVMRTILPQTVVDKVLY